MTDCIWNEDGPPWKCQPCNRSYTRQGKPVLSDKPPRRNCPKALDLHPGVGDVLHEILLKRLGVGMTLGCDCAKQIVLMNIWGPGGCRENINRIVGDLLNEAGKRNWHLERRPLLSIAARIGTYTPWGRAYARAWARNLVLEAISKCEE